MPNPYRHNYHPNSRGDSRHNHQQYPQQPLYHHQFNPKEAQFYDYPPPGVPNAPSNEMVILPTPNTSPYLVMNNRLYYHGSPPPGAPQGFYNPYNQQGYPLPNQVMPQNNIQFTNYYAQNFGYVPMNNHDYFNYPNQQFPAPYNGQNFQPSQGSNSSFTGSSGYSLNPQTQPHNPPSSKDSNFSGSKFASFWNNQDNDKTKD